MAQQCVSSYPTPAQVQTSFSHRGEPKLQYHVSNIDHLLSLKLKLLGNGPNISSYPNESTFVSLILFVCLDNDWWNWSGLRWLERMREKVIYWPTCSLGGVHKDVSWTSKNVNWWYEVAFRGALEANVFFSNLCSFLFDTAPSCIILHIQILEMEDHRLWVPVLDGYWFCTIRHWDIVF